MQVNPGAISVPAIAAHEDDPVIHGEPQQVEREPAPQPRQSRQTDEPGADYDAFDPTSTVHRDQFLHSGTAREWNNYSSGSCAPPSARPRIISGATRFRGALSLVYAGPIPHGV